MCNIFVNKFMFRNCDILGFLDNLVILFIKKREIYNYVINIETNIYDVMLIRI